MKHTALILLIGCSLSVAAFARTPNVVIFYADDMGIGDVGCYGCKDIRTPNIDALAADGVRFTNYYSAAPVCSPSRAAMLTGRYPARAGMPGNAHSLPGHGGLPTTEITIAELAKSRGYATALIGKWHLGFDTGTRPNDQGFDEFFGFHAGCIDYYSHMFYWQDPPNHDLYRNRQEIHEEGQYMTDLIAREAVRFVSEHGDKPFLLYTAFNAPHYPMQAPERLRRMYADLPPNRAIYAAMVTGMDEAIGKVLDAVRQRGLLADTLVFFASDNGATTEMRANGSGGSNAPYRGYKFSLFDGGIHMPAIIGWPNGIPQGQTRDQLVCGIDVLPTVAQAIGTTAPTDRTIDGISWMPIVQNAAAAGHDRLCWQSGQQSAIREGNWKLMRNVAKAADDSRKADGKGDDAIFLTDLAADPGETHNVRAQHADIADRLDATLRKWAEEMK
jgi:arylsulfatase A-like enzyme